MPSIKKGIRRPWMPERKPMQSGRICSNSKFYQSSAWRKFRAVKLARDPLCELCREKGRAVQAKVVDHVVPINQGGAALEMENLQSLCSSCHNAKSGRESHGGK